MLYYVLDPARLAAGASLSAEAEAPIRELPRKLSTAEVAFQCCQEDTMSLTPPYPHLSDFVAAIGEAGRRLSEISASEGAAGNISCYFGWDVPVTEIFPEAEPFTLESTVPELAGGTIIATGSGRRLREVFQAPEANLAAVTISADGASAVMHTSPKRLFARLTSEFNSHLAVHRDRVAQNQTAFPRSRPRSAGASHLP